MAIVRWMGLGPLGANQAMTFARQESENFEPKELYNEN